MKYMTVLKVDSDKTESVAQINLMDVDYIEVEKRRIAYFIGDNKCYQIMSKTELENCLAEDGFRSLDRPNLVNLAKVKNVDYEQGKVFFTKKPNENSLYATVARVKTSIIRKFFGD